MRISDWSSDVCSSDLKPIVDGIAAAERDAFGGNPNLAAYTSPSAVVGADSRGPFNKTKTQTYMAKFILDTSFGQVRWINGYRGVQSENIIDLDGSSVRSEEHTSELQSLMRISYAVFCLKQTNSQ